MQSHVRPADGRRGLTVAVAAAFLLAVALRWFVILRYYRDLPLGFTDNFWYHATANQLAEGRGFVNPFALVGGIDAPTAGHPPLYSLYLAGWSLIGADTALWHRLASGLISAAAVIPLAAAANRAAGAAAGAAAAFGAAVHPPLWMNDGLILSESLHVTVAALAIACAYRTADDPSTGNTALLAGVLAAAALTRSEAVLLFVLLLVPLILSRRALPGRERLRLLAVGVTVAAALLAPWTVRNLVTFEEPTLLASGAGMVLELGNCDETYSGDRLGYWTFDCETTAWPEGDESVVSAHKAAVAGDYMAEHLTDLPKVVAARIGRLFGVFRPFQTAEFDVVLERRVRSHVWLGLGMHWAATALAVGGAVVLRRRGRTLLPPLATVAASAVAAGAAFGITRYRIGADAAIVMLTAVGIAWALDRVRRVPSRPVAAVPT